VLHHPRRPTHAQPEGNVTLSWAVLLYTFPLFIHPKLDLKRIVRGFVNITPGRIDLDKKGKYRTSE
jgi:hypothetical protein